MGKGPTSRGLDIIERTKTPKSEVISLAMSPAEELSWQHRKREVMGRRLAEALSDGLTSKRSLLRSTATEVSRSLLATRNIKDNVNRRANIYKAPVESAFKEQNDVRVGQQELSKEDPNYTKKYEEGERKIAEKNERMRELMLNLIFTSPVFKEKYIEWKAEYESKQSDKNFNTLYPTVTEYVLRKGQQFMDSRRNDIIEGRLGTMSQLGEIKEEDEARKERARMMSETAAFVSEFYDDLLLYSSLKDDDPTKLRMLDALKKRLNVKNVKDKELLALLTGIAGDVYAAEAAKVNFVAAHVVMVDIVENALLNNNGVIDEEEWVDGVLRAISSNADEVLEERCSAGETALNFGVFDSLSSEQTFGSPMAVAHYAGVNIVGQVGENEYVVRFPGSSYQTRMKIEQVEGKNGRWSVKALDRFRDPNEGNWVNLEMGDLRYGFNKMFLDFELDSLRYRRIGTESPNSVVKDLPMMEITTHLYGWDENKMNTNVVTTPERRNLFTNLMVVLLKEERSMDHGNLGSLTSRVKKIELVLENPDYAVRIRRNVKLDGGRVWTISTLLDAIGYPRKTGEGRGVPIA